MESYKQLFSLNGIEGKTVKDYSYYSDEHFGILFTDNTYILIRAIAADGWEGRGYQQVEQDEYIPQQFFDLDNQ